MNTLQAPTLERLIEENSALKELVSSLQKKQAYLEEQLDWFQRQIFGKRSERVVKDLDEQSTYFPEIEEFFKNQASEQQKEEECTVAVHKRKKRTKTGKHDLVIPDDLPVERIELDIPDDEKICPKTNKPLVKIGEEVTRKLAHTSGSYFVKEYVRPKYAYPKESEEDGIKTQDMPDSILPKCQLDESFLAEIITRKFADHLPLYRISEILSRDGIGISRQYLSQVVVKTGLALKPLYDKMLSLVLESGNIFVDETPVDVLVKGNGKVHQGYMWVIVGGKAANPSYRVYDFRMNRKHENITDLLAGYEGNMHSDKYGAYEKLAKKEEINWCPCVGGHARRKFFEADSGDLEFKKWMLRRFRYISIFERIAWSRSPEERLRIREKHEIPIIDKMLAAVKNKLENGKLLPKSKFTEALGYFISLQPHLKNYTKDAYARFDNNVAERAMKPLAIGRKNWLFVGSPKGGEAAAINLSLVQSCRALGINPREYLEDVFRRLMSHSVNKLEELLPDNWAKARRLDTS